MHWIFAGLVALFVMSNLAGSAHAQKRYLGDPPEEINGEPFRKYVNGHDYFDELAKETMQYEAQVGACAAPERVERVTAGRPQVLTKFPRLGTPPQWMEMLRVTGCEEPVERAVLVLYINRKVVFLPLVAGSALSRFDVILQRDVIKTLIPVERVFALRAGCNGEESVRIVDTKTLSKRPIEGGLAWEEEWHLTNCKGDKRVVVSYRSVGDEGTSFQIKQVKRGE